MRDEHATVGLAALARRAKGRFRVIWDVARCWLVGDADVGSRSDLIRP